MTTLEYTIRFNKTKAKYDIAIPKFLIELNIDEERYQQLISRCNKLLQTGQITGIVLGLIYVVFLYASILFLLFGIVFLLFLVGQLHVPVQDWITVILFGIPIISGSVIVLSLVSAIVLGRYFSYKLQKNIVQIAEEENAMCWCEQGIEWKVIGSVTHLLITFPLLRVHVVDASKLSRNSIRFLKESASLPAVYTEQNIFDGQIG